MYLTDWIFLVLAVFGTLAVWLFTRWYTQRWEARKKKLMEELDEHIIKEYGRKKVNE